MRTFTHSLQTDGTFLFLTLNHMKAIVRLGLIAVLLTIGGISTSHAQVKLGFVDTEVIIQQLPEFKDLQAKIQVIEKGYVDTLQALEKNYRSRVDSYQKQQAMLTPDARAKEEQDLQGLVTQYQQFQQERLGPQGMLARQQAEMLEPIKGKIRTAIDKVAKDEKITAVMDKAMLIYFDQKYDITFKVLDNLKRGNN